MACGSNRAITFGSSLSHATVLENVRSTIMTTIACNHAVMAGDTLLTSDIKCYAQKVFKHKGNCVGIAGTYVDCMLFVSWWKKGAKGDAPSMKDVEALILTKDGRILCFDQHESFFELDDKFAAIGSGSQAALGAMHRGAWPKEAVQIASKVDPGTGFKTTVRNRGKK
jgi:ATP-dependent protease HslVU (ClpYQ) peptidase subunit